MSFRSPTLLILSSIPLGERASEQLCSSYLPTGGKTQSFANRFLIHLMPRCWTFSLLTCPSHTWLDVINPEKFMLKQWIELEAAEWLWLKCLFNVSWARSQTVMACLHRSIQTGLRLCSLCDRVIQSPELAHSLETFWGEGHAQAFLHLLVSSCPHRECACTATDSLL